MRTAVGTDSSSGISQAQAKELGIFVIPMPFIIGGKEYEDGVTLTNDEFYERMAENAEISTSQTSPQELSDRWDEILKEYDEIVYIPLSSGLSGAFQTAQLVAEDYDGRVQVVNNQRVSVTQRQSVLDACELVQRGYGAANVREILEERKFDSSIYITVDTLKYLKRGGRITPTAAALGTLLRIKPVLQIQGEKVDAFSRARTMKQGREVMLSALVHDLESRFDDPEAEHSRIAIAHTQNREMAEDFAKEIRGRFPRTGEIHIAPLSLNTACHIGPGSLGVACSKMITG